MSLRAYVRHFISKPMVRPWALSAPILVLVLCLPMLRPLRHPAEVSEDEALRLATVQSLAQTGTLALQSTPAQSDNVDLLKVNGRIYANQPPMMALLLTPTQWTMARLGIDNKDNAALVAYVLTLLGVTLPVAAAAGLLYRMGRLFELPRPWRAALATSVVVGSGLISYAVVLNPHAPAAVLVLCAAACLIHVGMSKLPRHGASWMILSGMSAALAATLDPPAGLIGLLLVVVLATMRFSIGHRILGILLFLLGAAVPITVHASWAYPVTGEIIPGFKHQQLSKLVASRSLQAAPATPSEIDADDVVSPPSWWDWVGTYLNWLWSALFGSHGLLSHFPVLLVGILGIAAVMHRHWPFYVKSLAGATGVGAILILAVYAEHLSDWNNAMFASRWFVVFLPLLLFWSGAWLRRKHSPAAWTTAGLLFVFSVAVALVGLTEPYPKEGFDSYTAVQALHRLMHPVSKDIIANR